MDLRLFLNYWDRQVNHNLKKKKKTLHFKSSLGPRTLFLCFAGHMDHGYNHLKGIISKKMLKIAMDSLAWGLRRQSWAQNHPDEWRGQRGAVQRDGSEDDAGVGGTAHALGTRVTGRHRWRQDGTHLFWPLLPSLPSCSPAGEGVGSPVGAREDEGAKEGVNWETGRDYIYTIDTVYKAGNWWEPTAQRRELCGDLRGKGGQERGDWCVSVYLTHSAGQQRVTQQWSKHTPIKKKAIKYRCLLWSSSSKNRCHFSRKNQRERIIKWK